MAEQSPPQDGSGGSESFNNLVTQTPQSMREDYIQNAVQFLSHPKVKGSPVFHRRSFLEKKGLTSEEIDEAFRRVPDPNPNSTDAAAGGLQQAQNPNQSVVMQPYAPVQSPQTATVTAGPIVPHTKAQFSSAQALLGAGVFVGLGASAAITLKKLFIPRLKSWTRRVVAEGDENEKDELNSKIYEEIREAIKVSASAFSDISRTNQEVLASKDEDRKVLMKLTEAFDSQANVFKSLNESLNHIRENRFSQYNQWEEHAQHAPWNGPIDYQGRASKTNMYASPPNSTFEPGRHSFIPLPAEPAYGSFPGSYPEQRVPRPGYGYQPPASNDRPPSLGARGSSYQGGPPKHHAAADDPAAVAAELQRRWAPPQPPGVVMPEAAAAIRQPARPAPSPQPADGRLMTSSDAARGPSTSEPAVAREQASGGGGPRGGGEAPSDASDVAAGSSSSSSGGGSEGQQQQQEEAA